MLPFGVPNHPLCRESAASRTSLAVHQTFFSDTVGEMRAAETDETHGAYGFYDALPSPRWRDSSS